jgi:hypothetical protein
MTFIASLSIEGCPIVFGDALLSGNQPEARPSVVIPTQGEASDFFGDSGWGPLGLAQKTAVVSTNCIIAWTGSWLDARSAITTLRDQMNGRTATVDEVTAYLEAAWKNSQTVSYTGFVHDGSVPRQFGIGCDWIDTPLLGSVASHGHGLDVAREWGAHLGAARRKVVGLAERRGRAVSVALDFAGRLLANELYGEHRSTTLQSGFGGCYEVGFFVGSRATKVRDALFVFSSAAIDTKTNEVGLIFPSLVMRQAYIWNHLVIRSVQLGEDQGTGIAPILDERLVVVPPTFSAGYLPPPREMCMIPLASEFCCHIIDVSIDGAFSHTYSLVQFFAAPRPPGIGFIDTMKGLRMAADPEELRKPVEAIWNTYVGSLGAGQ